MIENIDSKYIQTFEYETSMISDGNILGTCELGTATIRMINDSNTYSSLKGQWIKTIHGSFYVYDVKPVQEKVNIELSCYDIKYKLDTTYDSSKYTFPCTLKAWRNSIFTECGVTYDDSDFPNSDLNLEEEPYVGDNPSNRQVMSLIAQAGASFVITDKNDKFYFKWFKNTTNNIIDWLELTTEKESKTPINVVVLGRGDVEDNVYYPKTLPENKKELRIDNNYILDPQIASEEDRRNDVIESIYNQVNGFSFIPFTIRTQNVENKLSIDLGDKVSYKDIWGNSLSSYVMTKKITYLGGNPSDDDNYEITLSAEEINETSTEYSYGSSVDNRILKVERTTNKQNGEIIDLISKTDNLNTQTAQLRLDVDTIEGQISDIADITTTAEGTGTLVMGNINESEPIYIKIYPKLGDITSLYPANDLYPADDLYPLDKTLIFHCTSETYDKTYELPKDLLWLNKDTYDEFVLDYDNQTCYILHRVAINESGEKYALANVIQENFEYPNIPLVSGNYEVSLLGQPNAYLYIRLMVQNLYTNQFATKVEMNSKITQTAKEINIEVGEKVGKEEVIARINLTKETATIQANKVNINGVINAVNNNTTTTINGNKITTGSITASQIQTGTITADKVASDVITTNNFSAQTINADNIKAGTLSASSISLKGTQLSPTYSKVGGWTVNDSELSSGNSTIKSNGVVGFYPQVQNGGILALNDGFRCKAPNGVAIYNTHTGYGNSTSVDNGIHLCADVGNLDLMTEHSSYGVNIRSYCSPSSISNAGSRSIRLAAGQNIAMYAVGGFCYAEGNGVASAKIKTDKGSASSKNVKKNLKKFNDKKYDSAINILKNMDLYEYDYKYDLYKNRHQYGFLIDELEKLDRNEFFNFEEEEAIVKGEHLDFNMENKTKKDKTIKVKKYDSDVLDKYLLTVVKALLNKIEILENKVEKMERKEEKNEKNYPKNIDMHS